MIDLFLEGVEAIRLACTLALVVPTIGVVLAARRHAAAAVAAVVVAVSIVSWLRFADWWLSEPGTVLSIPLAFLLAGATMLPYRFPGPATAALGGATVGAIAAWLWIPCVGRELGFVITGALSDPWPELVPTFVYSVGVLAIVLVVAALPHAVPSVIRLRDSARSAQAGIVLAVSIAFVIAIGQWDDLVAELNRRSSY